jgi:dihydropteroate synthase
VVWGVLNVTPDSFSDGGLFEHVDAAVQHARSMLLAGADVIDVGGESTRPGAQRISEDAELQRVLPVIEALHGEGLIVSIDTMRANVVSQAVAAGAAIVNDVSGGRADAAMHRVVADLGVPYVLMHWRGHSDEMDALADYGDPVDQVSAELIEQVDLALNAGIDRANLILDPGLGFAKDVQHNWALLEQVSRLNEVGFPLLVGPSRKRFIGHLLADDEGTMRPVEERDVATAAMSALLAEREVWGLRVHEVRGTVDAIKVALAMHGSAG